MSILEEIISGTTPNAIFLTVIGEKFQKDFERISLPHLKEYCLRYGIGLLILKEYIDKENENVSPYSDCAGYQRLLIPEAIVNDFSQYKYICDLDVDCIPGPMARDIFSYPEDGLLDDTIYLTYPTPFNLPRAELGRRLSLLRKTFVDKTFPLDSLLMGSDEFEKETLGFNFSGPIATMGTCMGSARLIAHCNRIVYNAIASNFSGYLQNYKNHIFREEAKISWLPYEFQAIWSYEIAMFYPFLFSNQGDQILYDSLMATLLRVDMLHFAGTWPENNIFHKGPFFKPGSMGNYYKKFPSYFVENITPKSYGKLQKK
jgi:hypothetical protein